MKKFKKWIAVLITGLMMLSLAACGNAGTGETPISTKQAQSSEQTEESAKGGKDTEETDQREEENQGEQAQGDDAGQDNKTETGSDILVVFFSRTGEQYGVGVIDKGNTEIVADMIIEETGADRFEIVPAEDYYPYTYSELTDVAKREQNENARPAYAADVPDLSRYGTVYIGAPVWWGDWPMICYTFFENNADALAGKTLIPFSTHAGSGLSGFDSKLASACPNSTVDTGLAISGSDAQNNQDRVRSAVQDWIRGE